MNIVYKSKKIINKLIIFIAIAFISFFNTLPVQAFDDFYSESEIQFYDPNACDPNGGSGDPADTTTTPGEGIDYDNTQSADTGYEVSVESDGADGSASGDGSYQSGTSYGHNLGWKTHFVALNPGWAQKNGIKALPPSGDVVKITWKGKVVYAMYGDNHAGDSVHTEVSLSVKRAFLGNDASVATGFGSKSDPVKFTIYPGTGKKIKGNPPTNSLIDKVGAEASGVPASGGSEQASTTGGCVCSNQSTGVTTTLEGATREEKVWNYFIAKSLSPEQTAGIMGNMSQESGFDPLNIQDPGGRTRDPSSISAGWGIIQWTPGSKVIDIAKQANIKNPIYELATQLDIVWWHMNNTSPTGVNNMLEQYKKITDEVVATNTYEQKMEGAGIPAMANRIAAAKASLKKYKGSSPNGSSSSGGSDCSSAGVDIGTCSVNKPVYGSVNGSGNQYTQRQLAKIFGKPGTASSHPEMDKNLTEVDFNGHKVSVNKKAAGCLKAVAADIKARAISYKINQIGCYRYDSDNGSTNIGLRSYHTYGVACDINWDKNPFISGGTAPHDMPAGYVDAFHDHGWTWGGNWNSVKDYMHFEFNGVKP